MTIELAAETESEDLNASAREFFRAWRRRDMARIAPLLAPDCEWYRDGERISLADGAVFHQPDITFTVADVTAELVNVDHHGASVRLVGDVMNGPKTARRPVGFINLQFDPDGVGIGKVSESLFSRARASETRRAGVGARILKAIAKLIALAAYFVMDELVFSIPVVAVAAFWDPWRAFLLLTPVYFAVAMAIGVMITRLRRRYRATNGSALQRWLDAKTARQGTDWERRALVGFGLLGTGIVTILLGPIVTPWLAEGRGLDRRYGTAVGSVFWSVSLVATYSGFMALVL